MTAIEIIDRTDALEPNSYGVGEKLRWLSQLDGQIAAELPAIHDAPSAAYSTGEETLLVPFPYAEGVYGSYLRAMIAFNNFEASKYDQHIAMFDAVYSQYRDGVLRSGALRRYGTGFRL